MSAIERLAAVALLGLAGCAAAPVPKPRVCPEPPACPDKEVERLLADADKQARVDVDGAIKRYQEALALAPDDGGILERLSSAYSKKEDHAKAAEAMRRLAELAPDRADYWERYAGQLLLASRRDPADSPRWAIAEQAASRCVTIDPQRAECHAILGRIYRHRRDDQSALKSLTSAVRAAPTRLSYRIELGELYLLLEEHERAEQVLKASLPETSGDASERVQALLLLASVHEETGALAQAAAALQEAERSAGEEVPPMLLFRLGKLNIKQKIGTQGQPQERLQQFVKRVCKGARAQRYALQCEEAVQILSREPAP